MWYNSRVKVLYGFPQRLEITVDAPSLTDAETEELLALTASLLREEDFAANFTQFHSRRYGRQGDYHVSEVQAAPVGPDSASVQLRTDDTELRHMKRFVKCFFELLTQIIVKVRKCKVQRVCVLHFQLAGSGGCFFLMKLYH